MLASKSPSLPLCCISPRAQPNPEYFCNWHNWHVLGFHYSHTHSQLSQIRVKAKVSSNCDPIGGACIFIQRPCRVSQKKRLLWRSWPPHNRRFFVTPGTSCSSLNLSKSSACQCRGTKSNPSRYWKEKNNIYNFLTSFPCCCCFSIHVILASCKDVKIWRQRFNFPKE